LNRPASIHHQSFADFINFISFTPRTSFNPKNDLNDILKYLTWTLNINITISTFQKVKINKHKNQFVLRYKFQNTLVKLLRQPQQYKSLHILLFKKKQYIFKHSNMFPLLLNNTPQNEIYFDNVTITAQNILDILQKKNEIVYSFNINIFTAYSFVTQNSKQITNTMIGQYIVNLRKNTCATTEIDNLNIFITPHLENMYINFINIIEVSASSPLLNILNKQNLFVNTLKPEGDKTTFVKNKKENILNQNFCLCDHPNTQTFNPPKKYLNLGMHYNLTFFYFFPK